MPILGCPRHGGEPRPAAAAAGHPSRSGETRPAECDNSARDRNRGRRHHAEPDAQGREVLRVLQPARRARFGGGDRAAGAAGRPVADWNCAAGRSRSNEKQADRITHETVQLLHKTFITPLDRDEIHQLITGMDDILDLMEDVATCLFLYDVKAVTADAQKLAEICVTCTDKVREAVADARVDEERRPDHAASAARSTASRARPTSSSAPRSPSCSARSPTSSRSSSSRRSTSCSSRSPTSARTSPT